VNIVGVVLALLAVSGVVIVALLVVDMRKGKEDSFRVRLALPSIQVDGLRQYVLRLRQAVRMHPVPILGWIETAFWVIMVVALVDDLIAPRTSTTGQIIWMLTIGPHEAGHFICNPFGTLIMFMGGSIWQVLFWLGLALFTLLARRQITFTMVLVAITGHSFINLAVYIGDARSKQLPLLFGMGAEHHDWANILGMLNLLQFDSALAVVSVLIGAGIVLGAVTVGITTAWFLPRVAMGRVPRLTSNVNLFRALIDGVTGKYWVLAVENPVEIEAV
jgi:hypothetical protein